MGQMEEMPCKGQSDRRLRGTLGPSGGKYRDGTRHKQTNFTCNTFGVNFRGTLMNALHLVKMVRAGLGVQM